MSGAKLTPYLKATVNGDYTRNIPNILETLTRLGTVKPTCFGLLDFTAGYHQTPLDPASRVLTAFGTAGDGHGLLWD